jgi:cytochrome c peroxidase
MKNIFYISILIVFTISCKKESSVVSYELDELYILNLPAGFPNPDIPDDNKLTKFRVELGKKLFFDPILSKDYSISCASCHHPSKAFSDTINLSIGVGGRKGMRNSPSLANIAYNDFFFKDGGVPTMELQVTAPIQDHNEMDINILDVTDRLKAVNEYVRLSKLAYNKEPGPFVITRAISAFERTLISGNSDYDKFKNGNTAALTVSEKRGENLFFSNRTNCSSCHSGFNFTDNTFQDVGLYQNSNDSGRMRITLDENDRNKFVVPSLRNVEVTQPYMHDGSLATLEEVVDFFNAGGHLSVNKSNLVTALGLTPLEKTDLVNFLKSLTDDEFLNNKKFKP